MTTKTSTLDESFWAELKDEETERLDPIPTSFYLDPDLHEVINDICRINGKGTKSKLINESIRFALIENGLL